MALTDYQMGYAAGRAEARAEAEAEFWRRFIAPLLADRLLGEQVRAAMERAKNGTG